MAGSSLLPSAFRRRADGHLGPLDASCHAQAYDPLLPWLGFCPKPPADIARISPAEAGTQPGKPTSEDIQAYAQPMHYFQDLDGISAIQQQLRFLHRWMAYKEVAHDVLFNSTKFALLNSPTDPAIPTACNYMGVWANHIPLVVVMCEEAASVMPNDLVVSSLWDQTSVNMMHGPFSIAHTTNLTHRAIIQEGSRFWGMLCPDQLKVIRHGVAESREQGYKGPRTIPSQWTIAHAKRPEYSYAPGPIPRLEHLFLGILVCEDKALKSYRIEGAATRSAVAPSPSFSQAEGLEDHWTENRPEPWETPNPSLNHNMVDQLCTPSPVQKDNDPPLYKQAHHHQGKPEILELTRVQIAADCMLWVKPPDIQIKPSENTDRWDHWRLRVEAEEFNEEGKVTPIAFWSIGKKVMRGSEDEWKGTSFHLYDRLKQRVLLFPSKGYLALPDGLTNDTEEFRVPVPPYNFAVREQNGQLSFRKPSEWVYRQAGPRRLVTNTPAPAPQATDLPRLTQHGQMSSKWIEEDDDSDDDGDHGLPTGRFVVGPLEDLPRYSPPPPPFQLPTISAPATPRPAVATLGFTEVTPLPAVTASVQVLSSNSNTRLNEEEVFPEVSSTEESRKGKEVDVEMDEVETTHKDVHMGNSREVLQVVDENMVVDEEGFPVVDCFDLASRNPIVPVVDSSNAGASTSRGSETSNRSNNPQPPPNKTDASVTLKARRRKRVNTVKFGLNTLGIKIPKQRFKTVVELLELVKENAQDIPTETLAEIQRGKRMKLVPVLSLEERISDPSLAAHMDVVPLADQLETVDQGLDDRGGDEEMDIVSEEEEVNHASYNRDDKEEEETKMNMSKP
ncbi:hypothetical protein C8J56DRAFT_879906 [Mycena floridula]|nr:hypothetical protein C8J56DRAFT_879906 [Mycena floridula]